MVRLLAYIMLMGTLFFGGLAASAEAAHDVTAHCAELADAGCASASEEHGSKDKDGTPIHVDHHHCASFVVLDGDIIAQDVLPQASQVHPALETVLASRATAPPVQPPAA